MTSVSMGSVPAWHNETKQNKQEAKCTSLADVQTYFSACSCGTNQALSWNAFTFNVTLRCSAIIFAVIMLVFVFIVNGVVLRFCTVNSVGFSFLTSYYIFFVSYMEVLFLGEESVSKSLIYRGNSLLLQLFFNL